MPPSQRRCSTQQPPRACFAGSSSRRQPVHNKNTESASKYKTTSPNSISKRHHLAITIPSPARHSAAARQRTGVRLQNRTLQVPSSPPNKPQIRFTQHQTLNRVSKPNNQVHITRSHTSNINAARNNLTSPNTTIATPLLNPTTATGVLIEVVEPSPTCTQQTQSQQNNTSNKN